MNSRRIRKDTNPNNTVATPSPAAQPTQNTSAISQAVRSKACQSSSRWTWLLDSVVLSLLSRSDTKMPATVTRASSRGASPGDGHH